MNVCGSCQIHRCALISFHHRIADIKFFQKMFKKSKFYSSGKKPLVDEVENSATKSAKTNGSSRQESSFESGQGSAGRSRQGSRGRSDPESTERSNQGSDDRSNQGLGGISNPAQGSGCLDPVSHVCDLFVLQHLNSDPKFQKAAKAFAKVTNLDLQVIQHFSKGLILFVQL